MKTIAFAFPTMWDSKQLEACRSFWNGHFDVELLEPTDEDCPSNLDVLGYIEETVAHRRDRLDGITSSSDYPGATVAAAVATRLGLPGSAPGNILRCSHKYYSRIAQKEIVPESTAWFELVEPDNPAPKLIFPCYLKPVKGAFSILSQKIRDREELEAFLKKPAVSNFLQEYLAIFNQLVRGLTDFDRDGSYFLAEELLTGKQVTVEGFVTDSDVHVLGIVDSIRHPRTKSFARFDYPSSLSRPIRERMESIVTRLITHLGLAHTLFNVEMMYHERDDRTFIVEVNPRMCGQFADLYAKVDGTSSYEVALALAAGERPQIRRRQGRYRMASSFPLRIYEPRRVSKAPSSSEIASIEASFPQTLIWNETHSGALLSDFESIEDGKSARYGVVNVGAVGRKELLARYQEVVQALDYRFELI